MNRLLPRIDRSIADGLIDELMGLDVRRISAVMPAQIMFTFAPVGGVRAAPEFMLRIREHVVDLARLHGYPTEREQARLRSFDTECARLLHGELSITPPTRRGTARSGPGCTRPICSTSPLGAGEG